MDPFVAGLAFFAAILNLYWLMLIDETEDRLPALMGEQIAGKRAADENQGITRRRLAKSPE
jgi:hypothetical protein